MTEKREPTAFELLGPIFEGTRILDVSVRRTYTFEALMTKDPVKRAALWKQIAEERARELRDYAVIEARLAMLRDHAVEGGDGGGEE